MPPATPQARSLFDTAAAEYDAARPSYPAAVFDALAAYAGPLSGQRVLDWGAGTGISSRQLAERGASVVSLDLGEQMLRKAMARRPESACVQADGHRMPIRSATADIVAFAQSWHWFDQRVAAAEVARVMKPGGLWAAWWNRATADGERWFADYEDLMSSSCPGYAAQHERSFEQMSPDWADNLVAAQGAVEGLETVVVPWTRSVSAADWITDYRSHSYIIELQPDAKQAVLDQVMAILMSRFPDGLMTVSYVTTLLLARKAG